jgi:hypothetical protein
MARMLDSQLVQARAERDAARAEVERLTRHAMHYWMQSPSAPRCMKCSFAQTHAIHIPLATEVIK